MLPTMKPGTRLYSTTGTSPFLRQCVGMLLKRAAVRAQAERLIRANGPAVQSGTAVQSKSPTLEDSAIATDPAP